MSQVDHHLTIEELAKTPARALALPPSLAATLLAQAMAVVPLLFAAALRPLAPSESEQKQYLTSDEAARFLGISRHTLYQRTEIPRQRLGKSRRLRFDRAELVALLQGEHRAGHATNAEDGATPPSAPEPSKGRAPVYHRRALYR